MRWIYLYLKLSLLTSIKDPFKLCETWMVQQIQCIMIICPFYNVEAATLSQHTLALNAKRFLIH